MYGPETDRMTIARRVRINGIVQGVGFRPFVYGLARRWNLTGRIHNDQHGVALVVEGPYANVEAFVSALTTESPPLAVINQVSVEETAPIGYAEFQIVESTSDGHREVLVTPDSTICEDCQGELLDPTDRRYQYPFINCTNCGPRFTIIQGLPYDRVRTTMSAFPMCTVCHGEYIDPGNRRFHAEPVCCAHCGPQLRLLTAHRDEMGGEPISAAVHALNRGAILAIKGLGGYHLAARADDRDAVTTLRKRKHREEKPFAVMVPSIERARELCQIDASSEKLLASVRRPIVLLESNREQPIAEEVAPGTTQLGLMLPYTPLHHELLRVLEEPIVLTSGNMSNEPIACTDDDALHRLAGIADLFLTHDRPIQARADDSVTRIFDGQPMLLRRSRGYVPEPFTLERPLSHDLLACGAEQKNTFSLASGRHVFVSEHIGDLESYETLEAFNRSITHHRKLFDISPVTVAYDLHPEYLSTKYALALDGVEHIGIQHHHAHIASCLLDNAQSGPVLGVAFDGSGFGDDGTLWGGEFLLADLTGYRRLAHLEPASLPGGTTAIKQPWRMAVSYLTSCYGSDFPCELGLLRRNSSWEQVAQLTRHATVAPWTSSAGRLFDAVAALLDIRDITTFEGQAAIELEQLVDTSEQGSYPVTIRQGDVLCIRSTEIIAAVVEDIGANTPSSKIAARFHNCVADLITETCCRLRDTTGVDTVALSGGVFQNMILLERTVHRLKTRGFPVLTHHRIPPNDGGISLGQAVIAGTLAAAR